jgi:hypothetical protein
MKMLKCFLLSLLLMLLYSFSLRAQVVYDTVVDSYSNGQIVMSLYERFEKVLNRDDLIIKKSHYENGSIKGIIIHDDKYIRIDQKEFDSGYSRVKYLSKSNNEFIPLGLVNNLKFYLDFDQDGKVMEVYTMHDRIIHKIQYNTNGEVFSEFYCDYNKDSICYHKIYLDLEYQTEFNKFESYRQYRPIRFVDSKEERVSNLGLGYMNWSICMVGRQYEYSYDGKTLLSESYFSNDCKLKEFLLYHYSGGKQEEILYDENGRLTCQRKYFENGELLMELNRIDSAGSSFITVIEYDLHHRIKPLHNSIHQVYVDSILDWEWLTQYDKNMQASVEILEILKVPVRKHYTFSSEGILTGEKHILYFESGIMTKRVEFYKGNWLRTSVYSLEEILIEAIEKQSEGMVTITKFSNLGEKQSTITYSMDKVELW